MTDTVRNDALPIKILAIIGFSATILFLVWLLIVALKGSPSGFASLASIVSEKEAVQEEMAREEVAELSIATQKTIVNSRELFQLSWTDLMREGAYEFSFRCSNAPITLLVSSQEAAHAPLPCNTPLVLSPETTSLTLSAVSDRSRYAELPLILRFKNTDAETLFTTILTMTVVNAEFGIEPEELKEEPEVSTSSPQEETEVSEVVPETQEEPAQTTTYSEPQYIYPVSDPRGYIDIAITTRNVAPGSTLIDVVNNGTRTSGNWTLILRDRGEVLFSAPDELPLKPKEHATYTVPLSLIQRGFTATVTTGQDINLSNNSVSR